MKKIRESFVKRLVHLSKGWSICQKVRSICQKGGPFVKRVVHLSKGAVHLSKVSQDSHLPILLQGLSWRSADEDQAAKTAWKRREQSMLRCSWLLVRVIRCLGINQSASQSEADQWPKAWMLH